MRGARRSRAGRWDVGTLNWQRLLRCSDPGENERRCASRSLLFDRLRTYASTVAAGYARLPRGFNFNFNASYLQQPVAGAFLFSAVDGGPASSLTGSLAAGGCCAAGPTDISYPDIALQVHPDLDPTATAHAAANWQLCLYIYI